MAESESAASPEKRASVAFLTALSDVPGGGPTENTGAYSSNNRFFFLLNEHPSGTTPPVHGCSVTLALCCRVLCLDSSESPAGM